MDDAHASPKTKKWWDWKIWKLPSLIISALAAISALLIFLPRVNVVPVGQHDPENPYTEAFTVSSVGPLPLVHVWIRLNICSIETEKHDLNISSECNLKNDHDILLTSPNWMGGEKLEGHTITQDMPYAFILSDALNSTGASAETPEFMKNPNHHTLLTLSPLKHLDMLVLISYRPWPFPITISVPFHFVAEEQSNRKL